MYNAVIAQGILKTPNGNIASTDINKIDFAQHLNHKDMAQSIWLQYVCYMCGTCHYKPSILINIEGFGKWELLF